MLLLVAVVSDLNILVVLFSFTSVFDLYHPLYYIGCPVSILHTLVNRDSSNHLDFRVHRPFGLICSSTLPLNRCQLLASLCLASWCLRCFGLVSLISRLSLCDDWSERVMSNLSSAMLAFLAFLTCWGKVRRLALTGL